jgi:hypothetical protein
MSLEHSDDKRVSLPACCLELIAAGLTGTVAGFAASFADAIVSTQMGEEGVIFVEVAHALAILVPVGCLAGVVLMIGVKLLGRICLPAQRAALASFPYLLGFGIFVYLEIYYFQGMTAAISAYIKCALMALVSGIPTYIGLRFLWRRLSEGRALVMILVGTTVGACAAFMESFIAWSGLWKQ